MPDYAGNADRQRIWEAAYAAAFVAEFHKFQAVEVHGKPIGFDRALNVGSLSETACTVANAAVAQLDDWITNGRA